MKSHLISTANNSGFSRFSKAQRFRISPMCGAEKKPHRISPLATAAITPFFFTVMLCCFLFSPDLARAQPSTTVAVIRPSLAAAIDDLSSDQYKVRQHGSQELHQFLAGQMAIMIQALGPEKGNRITKILRFNVEVSRWAQAVLSLPVRQRAAMFQWGLDHRRISIVAKAFSPHPGVRAGAAKAIARWPGANADWLLHRLLADTHRLVYLSAMDALWQRKPTPTMVRLVWRKVIANGGQFIPPNPAGRFVMFHGQKIIVPKNNNFWMQLQDSVYAEQLMAHWNPPELAALLTQVAQQAARQPNGPMANLFANPGNSQVLGYIKLFHITRPAAAVPYFLHLILLPNKFGSQMNFNNTPTYWDNHTNVVYLLAVAAKQKPAALGFFHSPFFGGRWLFHNKGSQNQAIKKLTALFAKKGIKPWQPNGPTSQPTRQSDGIVVPRSQAKPIPPVGAAPRLLPLQLKAVPAASVPMEK